MRTIIITLTFVLASLVVCQAQQIEMERVFGGYKFTQDGEQLNMANLVSAMETHQQAYEIIKKTQSQNSLAKVFGFVGGGLIGWPIGTAVGGGDPNWAIAGVGVGLIAIGIPIQSSVNRNAREAVNLYNRSFNTAIINESRQELKIIVSGTGVGLSVSF